MSHIKKIFSFLKKEIFVILLVVLLIILLISLRPTAKKIFESIDWQTLEILLTMMLITENMKESGIFSLLAEKIISKTTNKNGIAIGLITFSAIISAFLTNDVSLFVIIPLLIALKKHFGKKYHFLIIYVLFAVNIGSSLTPFGNPQNIFIWRKWDIDLHIFILKMLPAFFIQFTLLIIFVSATFAKQLIEQTSFEKIYTDKSKLISSIFLILIFVSSIEFNADFYIFPAIIFYFVVFAKKIFQAIDFKILLYFILIFIDFNLLSNVTFDIINLKSPQKTYFLTILFSQIAGNVPATVFISNFAQTWQALALGANVAAQGIIISSMANLIGLRISKEKNLILKYHLLAIPFLLISMILIFLLLIRNL